MKVPPSLLQKAGAGFEAFVSREPLFSVLAAPEYRAARVDDDTRRRFFEGGETVVSALYTTIELRVAPHFAPTAPLEYGCGPGRLAFPIALRADRRGGHLTAVDRSAAMLGMAREGASRRALTNIVFIEPKELFADSAPRFDFVNCYLVLQRLEERDGLALIEGLARLLLPGGIAAFQFPVASAASLPTRFARWSRESLPGANAIANLVRKQPAAQPYLPAHVYNVNGVIAVLSRCGFPATHVVFDDHGDLDSVIAIAEAPLTAVMHRPAMNATSPAQSEVADVQELIAHTSIDELNRNAESYFATLEDWTHHLAKPFASADEAPWLLANAALLLEAAALRGGLTVLEFGAGTGWLSRFLTQMGCRAILLDVSPTALRIAQSLYERLPVFGARPAPAFLQFDGRTIDLPDGSVDRVICFHAFHHAPNPDTIIAEFGRILRPGGRAVFAEPGPRHSRATQSQFEMKSYRVVENDVDVHAIWRAARHAGFTDLRLLMSSGSPMGVSLDQYEDFLRGGSTTSEWLAATRVFLRNVRNFVLVKGGHEPVDSRSAAGLRCEVQATLKTGAPHAGEPIRLSIRVSNTGTATWLPSDVEVGGVALGCRVYNVGGLLIRTEILPASWSPPARAVAPGEARDSEVTLPGLPPGQFILEFDCVSSQVIWFVQVGSQPARVAVNVQS